MLQTEHVAQSIGGGQPHSRRADDRGIDQRDREQNAGGFADIFFQPSCDAAGIREVAELGMAGERCRRKGDDCDRSDQDDEDANPQIDALIIHEARRDTLVDQIGLLKKKLPRRDRGSHHTDDQQHDLRQVRSGGYAGDQETSANLAKRRMDHDKDRDQQQRADDKGHADPLEAPEGAGTGSSNHDRGSDQHPGDLWKPKIIESQADADELGDDRQRIEDEQIDDAERAPEFAEPFKDQAGVTDAGDDSKAEDHLLVDVEDRHQQQQHPKKAGAVILSCLRIGAKSTGIVVAGHHDEARANDREQRH